jgi:ATP-dependent helicase/DNAse subunit B
MRLFLGPPGSGKTTCLLDEVRKRVRAGRADFRYVTPTATMQEHVTNLLAREGLLVRPSTIVTLADVVDALAPGPVASGEDLRLLTRQVLARRMPAGLRESPGLADALAGATDELANAGCGPGQWAALGSLRLWEGAAMRALGEVYEELDETLHESGLLRRPAQLAAAMQRLRKGGLAGVEAVFVDGFFTFSPYEFELLTALGKRVRLEVTLPEWAGAREAVDRLRAAGFQVERLAVVRAQPESVLCPAPNQQREVEEIALRILEAHREGLAWRECGVILRARQGYGPLLESAFERFGIPWRAYYAQPLMQHSAARCVARMVEARLSGWEHELTLEALAEPACRASAAPEFVAFTKAVREGLPKAGLDSLAERAAGEVRAAVDLLAAWPGGDGELRSPADWAESLDGLIDVLRPPRPETVDGGRGAAVQVLLRTAASVARLLPDEPVALATFWREAQPAMAAAGRRDPGRRRDAVHLLDVYEARQWELPVVFVCGLIEGEFPRRPEPDPILTDGLRLRLREQGVPVRLASEREAEERFVFELAQTRATRRVVYSWPQLNEKGDPTLRSFALDLITGQEAAARRVALLGANEAPPLPPPALDDHALRARLAAMFEVHRTTALESFLQCPFQFYLRFTVELEDEPETPAERLNALFTGNVLHDVLKDFHQQGGAMERIFESVWTRALARNRIPGGHAVEFHRSVLRRSLLEYSSRAVREEGWRVFVERPFELQLNGCKVKGRIDRYDLNEAGEARVYDYKYTSDSGLRRRQQRQEEGLALQGGLYLLALAREGYAPVSFQYVGVKNEVSVRGWDGVEKVRPMMEQARAAAEEAALRILEGRIEVNPRDRDACAWCEFEGACRIQSVEAERAVRAAG